MRKKKFLNEKYLQETPYLIAPHFPNEAKELLNIIQRIRKSCVFGLIGDFGVGKSTMLNDMRLLIGKNDIRINFYSWKFPERKELWDGFVLSVTAKIENNS